MFLLCSALEQASFRLLCGKVCAGRNVTVVKTTHYMLGFSVSACATIHAHAHTFGSSEVCLCVPSRISTLTFRCVFGSNLGSENPLFWALSFLFLSRIRFSCRFLDREIFLLYMAGTFSSSTCYSLSPDPPPLVIFWPK